MQTRAIKTATIFMNLAAACLLIVLGIITMSMAFRTRSCCYYLEKKSPKVKAKLKIDVKSRERSEEEAEDAGVSTG
ncbi:unnamed protein product [Brassica napus]|uniref:(rape) hypothetical protein n=1 Tax=Brassica napus TaxID=3708 RepID=A0A816KRR2_BRANA|nr:unnamed protein product [Brassica napus]